MLAQEYLPRNLAKKPDVRPEDRGEDSLTMLLAAAGPSFVEDPPKFRFVISLL